MKGDGRRDEPAPEDGASPDVPNATDLEALLARTRAYLDGCRQDPHKAIEAEDPVRLLAEFRDALEQGPPHTSPTPPVAAGASAEDAQPKDTGERTPLEPVTDEEPVDDTGVEDLPPPKPIRRRRSA